jgi:hypothetical protein
MPFGLGAGLNTFTPAFDPAATGALQVEFTRSPSLFRINKYVKLTPVSQMAGYYMRVDPKQGTRVVSVNDQIWPIGQDRPSGRALDADFVAYQCQRYTEGFQLGTEVVEQAKFDVLAMHARHAATLLMTGRTRRAWTEISTAGNYTSGENLFANTTALTGGAAPWNSGADNANIQTGITTALQKIQLNSGGVVSPSDVKLVINPNTARTLATQPEIRNYVKNYPAALDFLRGDQTFALWGLPSSLFGVGELVVEDAVYVSTRKGAGTQTSSYVCPDNVAFFCGRPEGLIGVEGVPSFAGVTCFAYEDMTMEIFSGATEEIAINRRVRGGVTDNSGFDVTAPASCLYLTTCFT